MLVFMLFFIHLFAYEPSGSSCYQDGYICPKNSPDFLSSLCLRSGDDFSLRHTVIQKPPKWFCTHAVIRSKFLSL